MNELSVAERFKLYADVVLTPEQCRAANYLERHGLRAFADFGYQNVEVLASNREYVNRSKAVRKAWRKRKRAQP